MMKLPAPVIRLASWPARIRGMFNLNDPRWGRGSQDNEQEPRRNDKRPNDGPPDLDQMWRDFNQRLNRLFGGQGGGRGLPGAPGRSPAALRDRAWNS